MSMDNCTDPLDLLITVDPFQSAKDPIKILYSVVPILMTVFTVVGNAFVIVAICSNKRLARKHTSILILNLASADLLVGSGVMPPAIVQILTDHYWIFGRVVCRVWTGLDVVCCTASIFTLCIISVDRYVGVTRPLAYSYTVTRGRLCVAVLLVWAFSVAVLLATLQWNQTECRDPSECAVDNELQYVVHSVVMSFFIPLVIILIVYYKIYQVTRKRESSLLHSPSLVGINSPLAVARQPALPSVYVMEAEYGEDKEDRHVRNSFRRHTTVPASTGGLGVLPSKRRSSTASVITETAGSRLRIHYGCPDDGDVNKQRRCYNKHKKTAKTLSLVVGAFLVSWAPFFVLYLIRNVCDDCIPRAVMEIFTWLGYSNSALNPIIYAVSMRTFGDTMRQTLSRIFRPQIFRRNQSQRDLTTIADSSDRRTSRFSYASNVSRPMICSASCSRPGAFGASFSASESTNLSSLAPRTPTSAAPDQQRPSTTTDSRFLHPYLTVTNLTSSQTRFINTESNLCPVQSNLAGAGASLAEVDGGGVVRVYRWNRRESDTCYLDGAATASPPPPDPKHTLDSKSRQLSLQESLLGNRTALDRPRTQSVRALPTRTSSSSSSSCRSLISAVARLRGSESGDSQDG